MTNLLFLGALVLIFALTLPVAFRHLPRERWQFLATLPLQRLPDGRWQGINLTWYGLLSANAYVFAVALFLLLMAAQGAPTVPVFTLTALLLGLCIPASSLVARWVEGKAHTFTVGGAVFVGTLTAPWCVLLIDRLFPAEQALAPLALLAPLAVSYSFGEGLGRLGCLSFGCCYGKPLAQCSPRVQRLFRRWSTVFEGETKKIAYAHGLQGQRTLPVQTLTTLLYLGAGLVGLGLLLAGHFGSAFLLCMTATLGWRVASELLRADYRGDGRISAYQWMSLGSLPYCALLPVLFPLPSAPRIDLLQGLATLWQPVPLLGLLSLWGLIFVVMGRSKVSGSELQLHIHPERI